MTNIDEIIFPAKYHRSLNGFALAEARQVAGLSQEGFAKACGWSQQYQAQLEHGDNEIWLVTAEMIIKVLKECSK